MSRFVVCALYKFVRLDDHQALREPLYDTLVANQVRGTLLLASEGINGTIAGSRAGIDAVLDWLHGQPQLADIVYKESLTDSQRPDCQGTPMPLCVYIVIVSSGRNISF